MFTEKALSSLLLFDIETAAQQSDPGNLSPRLASLWTKRAEYLRNREKHPENRGKTDFELFTETAGLHAEFGRIVCITFGVIKFTEGRPKLITKSVYGKDEVEILQKSFKIIEKACKDNELTKLCGHNIKRFDIPFIGKRAMIDGLELPSILKVQDKKPWEFMVVDTSELWSFGAWQEGFVSLDLIAACLGLPSPKDEMDGSKVNHEFWENDNVEKIAHYCEKDVTALAQILLRLSKMPDLVEEAVV